MITIYLGGGGGGGRGAILGGKRGILGGSFYPSNTLDKTL